MNGKAIDVDVKARARTAAVLSDIDRRLDRFGDHEPVVRLLLAVLRACDDLAEVAVQPSLDLVELSADTGALRVSMRNGGYSVVAELTAHADSTVVIDDLQIERDEEPR